MSKALYIKLYENILKDIENKKYSNSSKLPSENNLASKFEVNRHTVRQALKLLKDQGYIYTKQGKGNFISNIKVPYSISNKSSYSSKILDLGYEPKTKLLSAKIIVPNEDVAKVLGLNNSLKVIEVKLLRFVNDIPISVSYSYFDAFLYQKLMQHLDEEDFSLYKSLQEAYPKLIITKQSTIFEALSTTSEFSELLLMPKNSPLLSVCTISKDQDGNYVEYGTSYFRADTCKIKIDLV